MNPRIQNITGEKFGRLTAKKYLYTEKGQSSTWFCECECGNTTKTVLTSLKNGSTQSCGCLQRERASENKTHNRTKTTEYYAWSNMIQRCTNKNHPEYKNYGARGITVCNEWEKSFEKFLEDMGEKPRKELSLDRIDNNKGYFKENCRWATGYMQAVNQRSKENKTTGIKNISYSKRDDLYYVSIGRKGKRYRKSFKELEDAVKWKEKTLNEISLTSTTIKREG